RTRPSRPFWTDSQVDCPADTRCGAANNSILSLWNSLAVAEHKHEHLAHQADDVLARIADMADAAPQPPFLHGPSLAVSAVEETTDGDDDSGPSSQPGDVERASPDALKLCAALDQSDTDNGMRLRTYFGGDLLVIAQEGITGGDYLAWSG